MSNPSSSQGRSGRPASSGSPSIISADVHIVGDLATQGELQIDGKIEGDIRCGSLTMGEHGQVSGSILADSAIVKGRVEGRLQAKQVRLERSAYVEGDIYHESLSVEAGAQLTGKVIYGVEDPARKEPVSALAAPSNSLDTGDDEEADDADVRAIG